MTDKRKTWRDRQTKEVVGQTNVKNSMTLFPQDPLIIMAETNGFLFTMAYILKSFQSKAHKKYPSSDVLPTNHGRMV